MIMSEYVRRRCHLLRSHCDDKKATSKLSVALSSSSRSFAVLMAVTEILSSVQTDVSSSSCIKPSSFHPLPHLVSPRIPASLCRVSNALISPPLSSRLLSSSPTLLSPPLLDLSYLRSLHRLALSPSSSATSAPPLPCTRPSYHGASPRRTLIPAQPSSFFHLEFHPFQRPLQHPWFSCRLQNGRSGGHEHDEAGEGESE